MILRLIRGISLTFALLSSAGMASAVMAQDDQSQQGQVKVANLYHFLQQVKWPNEESLAADTPIVIGIVGRDAFGEATEALARRKVRGRAVVVRRFADAQHIERCHLLFVAPGMASSLPEILRRAESFQALTVSDMREFVGNGGMIGFVVGAAEQDAGVRVRFEVNLDAARRRGLQVSSKLLELATYVKQ